MSQQRTVSRHSQSPSHQKLEREREKRKTRSVVTIRIRIRTALRAWHITVCYAAYVTKYTIYYYIYISITTSILTPKSHGIGDRRGVAAMNRLNLVLFSWRVSIFYACRAAHVIGHSIKLRLNISYIYAETKSLMILPVCMPSLLQKSLGSISLRKVFRSK